MGAWRDFYRRWRETTREQLDPRPLELVPELSHFVPPALIYDKPVYSAFASRKLLARLMERSVDT